MASAVTQQRLIQWQSALRNWPNQKHNYAHFTYPFESTLVRFLEGLLVDSYGESIGMIVEAFRRARTNPRENPLVAYIVVVAEQIEPTFKQKLIFLKETTIVTALEAQRSRSDYFGYLIIGDAEESKESYVKALNIEVAIIGKLLVEKYSETLKPIVLQQITNAIRGNDIATKQFMILMAIYIERDYRKRFLPEVPDETHIVRTKPDRFITFVTKTLPPRVRRLKDGIYCGLLEFLNETRPCYFLLE